MVLNSDFFNQQSHFYQFTEELVCFHYELAGFKKPEIHIVNDPLKLDSITNSAKGNIHYPIWKALLEKVILASTQYAYESLGKEEYKKIFNKNFKPLQDLSLQLNKYFTQIGQGKKWALSTQLSLYDWDCLNFLKALEQQGLLLSNEAKIYTRLYHQGIYNSYLSSEIAFICPMPRELHLDDSMRPHHEYKYAIKWNDDFKACFFKGVLVPEKLILEPENFSKEDILLIHNAEVRRCVMEHLGSQRFATLLDLEEIDKNTDASGNEQFLMRTRKPDPVAREHIQFAQVLCPSTHRMYYLCVPPHIKSVSEAVAWTFGKEPESYKPDIET